MNAENWNQLTTDGSEEENYRHYDTVIATVLENLYSFSSKEEVIRLYRFDRKNLEHMCILRIALIARDLFDFPVEVEASWWDVVCLNWQLRKDFYKVKRYKLKMTEDDPKGVNVLMLIDKFHDIIKNLFGDFDFVDIYKAYYERKM